MPDLGRDNRWNDISILFQFVRGQENGDIEEIRILIVNDFLHSLSETLAVSFARGSATILLL